MTRARMWQVYSLLAVFLAGHAIAIAKTKELWPFSRYPMYAKPQRSAVFNQVLLYGVGKRGKEIPITARQLKIAAPMLRKQLAGLERDNKRRPERVEQKLAQYINWYRSRGGAKQRRAGLTGVRVYKLQYALDASGVKTKKPLSRTLIAEYRLPRAHKPATGASTHPATRPATRAATRAATTAAATRTSISLRPDDHGARSDGTGGAGQAPDGWRQ